MMTLPISQRQGPAPPPRPSRRVRAADPWRFCQHGLLICSAGAGPPVSSGRVALGLTPSAIALVSKGRAVFKVKGVWLGHFVALLGQDFKVKINSSIGRRELARTRIRTFTDTGQMRDSPVPDHVRADAVRVGFHHAIMSD